MPVYNGARYLEGAVRSLLNQTERDFVILISDNSSSDETRAICGRLAAEDPRIKYTRHGRNIGATRNFEYVLRAAESPFFMWAAHDDARPPEYLAEALSLLRRVPDAVGCALGVDVVDEFGGSIRHIEPPAGLASGNPAVRSRAMFRQGHFAIYGLFRRAELQASLPVPNVYGADVVLAHRLALRSRFVVSDTPVFAYRYLLTELKGKRAGPDGHLYEDDARRRATHRAMLKDTRRMRLPFLQEALIKTYIHYIDLHDWRAVAQAQRRRALEEHRHVRAFGLSLRLVALSPLNAIRFAKQTLVGLMRREPRGSTIGN